MSSLLSVLLFTLGFSASNAMACGGDDLSNEKISQSVDVYAVIAKVRAESGTEVSIEKIVRAGAYILDLDEKPGAQAMCNANFTHVYFKSNNGTRCLLMLDIRAQGKIHRGGSSVVTCRNSAGQSEDYIYELPSWLN